MKRNDLNELQAFVAVADEGSFTRAATKLGISPSALSHAMKALELRLGVQLLARTTRSVAPTVAGERLLATLRPAFRDIEEELTALGSLRDTPSGTVRITTFRHAAMSVIMPALPGFLERYPDVTVEVDVDLRRTDIVADRFDAGIRWPDQIDKDMIAVTVGPPLKIFAVASPSYFAKLPVPRTPRDLLKHRCFTYRLASGGILPLELERERDGRTVHVKASGPFIANDGELGLRAALDGIGITMYHADAVIPHLEAGRLVRVLEKWSPVSPGYQLYYPRRRHPTPALAALIAALRARLKIRA
jgi:DNA-binding transcriptional LysR family regulator